MTAPQSVDEYLAQLSPDVRKILQHIRKAVRAVAPAATERISYGMPALFDGGVVVYYAAFRQHVGVYPPVADPTLRKRLARYLGPKGNLKFPLDEAIPYDLIAEVAAARLRENRARRNKEAR
jgi:uncharacterized protein YdhG (YjbR/CyaY superfamily)